MNLIITIDTEEDNWGRFQTNGHTLQNIKEIPRLQELFDKYNVKPTYLISYPVATDKKSISILKTILDADKCEIGTHCHPWNTPPFEEELNEFNSMLCNLPADLQYRKIENLHAAIKRNFGIEPRAFRAGRFGYNKSVAKNLIQLKYRVDTSITPFTDWSVYYGPDFSRMEEIEPYSFQFNNFNKPDKNNSLLEIPVSVGFLQVNFAFSNRLMQNLKKKPFQYFHILGILKRLKLLNLLWLSPELNSADEMIGLLKTFAKRGNTLLNMTFHSTSLIAGSSPFVKDDLALKDFYLKIETFLRFAFEKGIESMTVSEAAMHYVSPV